MAREKKAKEEKAKKAADTRHKMRLYCMAEIVEIKQGPYAGSMDKVRFEPIDDSVVKIKG